jgi:hypothetical protein
MVGNDHTVQDHGPKRSRNHGHVHAPKMKELMYIYDLPSVCE